jgi:hypothetical protein
VAERKQWVLEAVEILFRRLFLPNECDSEFHTYDFVNIFLVSLLQILLVFLFLHAVVLCYYIRRITPPSGGIPAKSERAYYPHEGHENPYACQIWWGPSRLYLSACSMTGYRFDLGTVRSLTLSRCGFYQYACQDNPADKSPNCRIK